MASRPSDFDVELEVDRLEAIIEPAVVQWLRARLLAHERGAHGPPAPAELVSFRNLQALQGLAAYEARAEQLWRSCRRAHLHAATPPAGLEQLLAVDGASLAMLESAVDAARSEHVAQATLSADMRERISKALAHKSPVDVGLGWLSELGFDLTHVRIVEPGPGDARGSRTYLIDPPHDLAIVVSWQSTLSSWREVWHELGHAVFASCHQPEQAWSLRDAPSPIVHEAFAELVASRLDSAATLAQLVGLDAQEAQQVATWRRYRRHRWRLWLCDHIHEHTRPDGNARYVIADALARRLRVQVAADDGRLASTIRAAAAAGVHYEWKQLLVA